MCQSHYENLDLRNLSLAKIAQADTCCDDAKEQPKRKVIIDKRDIAESLIKNASGKQEENGHKKEASCQEETRRADLQKAVNCLKEADATWHRFHKESEVAQENHQEAVMEEKRKNPKPFGGIINKSRSFVHRVIFKGDCLGIAEQGAKKTDFQEHTDKNTEFRVGTVEFFLFDEIERPLLSSCCGDGKGHRRFRPIHHASDEPNDKDAYCHIGKHNAKKGRESYTGPDPGNRPNEQHHE